jgi:hypothetical protein
MPIVSARLARDISKNLLSEFSKVLKAKKTSAQQKLGKAVAEGVFFGFTGAKGKIIPTGGPGVGTGIKGIDSKYLAGLIVNEIKKTFKSKEGVATKAFATAIAKAVIKELNLVTVSGTGSGRASQFASKSPASMALMMLKASGFNPTPENRRIFLCIAKALSKGVKAKGFCMIAGSGPPAGNIATIL